VVSRKKQQASGGGHAYAVLDSTIPRPESNPPLTRNPGRIDREFEGRALVGARPTPKALIARRWSAIFWTSNDDGAPMSNNTLNKALQIMSSDIGPGGVQRTHGYRLTASSLLNGEVTPRHGEKNAVGPTRWCGARATGTRSEHLWPCGLLGRTRAFDAALF